MFKNIRVYSLTALYPPIFSRSNFSSPAVQQTILAIQFWKVLTVDFDCQNAHKKFSIPQTSLLCARFASTRWQASCDKPYPRKNLRLIPQWNWELKTTGFIDMLDSLDYSSHCVTPLALPRGCTFFLFAKRFTIPSLNFYERFISHPLPGFISKRISQIKKCARKRWFWYHIKIEIHFDFI